VSAHVAQACKWCGGSAAGFIKTGRDPALDFHAAFCPKVNPDSPLHSPRDNFTRWADATVHAARTLHDAHVPFVEIARQLGVPSATLEGWLSGHRRASA
jgi:hypothetical protein